jgi:hypothetical protein
MDKLKRPVYCKYIPAFLLASFLSFTPSRVRAYALFFPNQELRNQAACKTQRCGVDISNGKTPVSQRNQHITLALLSALYLKSQFLFLKGFPIFFSFV